MAGMAAVGELGYFTGAGHRRGDGKKEALAVLVGGAGCGT